MPNEKPILSVDKSDLNRTIKYCKVQVASVHWRGCFSLWHFGSCPASCLYSLVKGSCARINVLMLKGLWNGRNCLQATKEVWKHWPVTEFNCPCSGITYVNYSQVVVKALIRRYRLCSLSGSEQDRFMHPKVAERVNCKFPWT